ncbi:MAG: FprA family A-type flavoprotein [Candidatus Omnitrophica bacterium]|nr:FprA family A-type flavoprotein [Candidatus Omnitrophota bacterium]
MNQGTHWVGYIDWDLRNFHGYATPTGSTYNAYLLEDEQPTLIDTVKNLGADAMIREIRRVMDPARIRYIVSNHTEMDHSGAIDEVLALAPKAEVICSPKGEEGLKRHFKKNWRFRVVADGEEIKIGRRTLKFVHMPMVHWPDSMATYCMEDKTLFSNDAFGQHMATHERYADEVGPDRVMHEAAKYYANIVLPYGAQVQRVLAALKGVALELICPSHGLMWRREEDIRAILSAYSDWSAYKTEPRALIVYDTMWKSTRQLAEGLYKALGSAGINVKIVNLQLTGRSEIMADVLLSRFLFVGSSILNNRMLPTVAGFMTYLAGLKPKSRWGATFGSYGWSRIGFQGLETLLNDSGVETLTAPRYIQYIPEAEDLDSWSEWVAAVQRKF